jgi:tetratricopeptide (TPR) repeat protein
MSSPNTKPAPDRVNLALHHLDAKKLSETIEELERLRKQDPLNTDVLFRLGLAHQKLEHADEAEHCYTEVLRIDPNFVDAWLNRGLLRAQVAGPFE